MLQRREPPGTCLGRSAMPGIGHAPRYCRVRRNVRICPAWWRRSWIAPGKPARVGGPETRR